MSILLRSEIIQGYEADKISLKPFNKNFLGPNSIDVTLSPVLKTYTPMKIVRDSFGYYQTVPFGDNFYRQPLDVATDNETFELEIPDEGLVLSPGVLYLGSTNEVAGSKHYIPMYEGRSSMARLGIQSHVSAGFGDIGFEKKWTLEITVVHPVRIYAGTRIGQVYFHQVNDEALEQLKKEDSNFLYNGKYCDQDEPTASQSYKDFTKNEHNKVVHVAHR